MLHSPAPNMDRPSALGVLVVDGDDESLQFAHRVLSAHGDRVVAVREPAEALAKVRSEKIDLVLVSLTLPSDGGLALVHHLRALDPSCDLVVMASADDRASVAQASSLGAATTVLKPLSGDDLLLAVDRVRERRVLLAEHAQVETERKSRKRRARAYRRCLPFVEESEPSLLPEMIVDVFAGEFEASRVVLYLPAADDAETLVVAGVHGEGPAPADRQVARLPEKDALRAGEVVLLDADGRHLLVPLHASHTLVGLAEIRIPAEVPAADVEAARVVADLAAASLRNARRFEALARSGIKDPTTSAYTFAYFVDHAGREIDKARRYGRQFSLGILTLDGMEKARRQAGADGVHRLSLRIVDAMLEVVRDTDVVARVEDDEIHVFMPETGALGSVTCRRRVEERLSSTPEIVEALLGLGLEATMGLATYPGDGSDLSSLLRRCRLTSERVKGGTLRRLDLRGRGFWDIVDALVGDPEAYALRRDGSVLLHRALQASEQANGWSRHHLLPPSFVDRMAREIAREATKRPSLPGVLYGDAGTAEAPGALLGEAGSALHVWVIGARGVGHDETTSGRAVWIDDPRLATHRFLLHVGERAAYGLLARPTASGDLAVFHTCEPDLVEALVVGLQAEYHLQRSLF